MRPLAPGILINRSSGDPLYEFLLKEGYLPISCPLTIASFNQNLPSQLKETLSQNPSIEAWIITSPTSGRLVESFLPAGCKVISTKASRDALLHPEYYDLIVSDEASSEALLGVIKSLRPSGGNFLLYHGYRSRQVIEKSFMNTGFRISTLISHMEIPNPDLRSLPEAGAYLALSPLQAELFSQKAKDLFPIGWGKLLERTFIDQGLVEYRVCDPTLPELHALLKDIYQVL